MNIPVKLALTLVNKSTIETSDSAAASITSTDTEVDLERRPESSMDPETRKNLLAKTEIVVPYQTNRWIEKKLGDFRRWESPLKLILALIFLSSAACFGFTATFGVATVFSIVFIMAGLWQMEQPSALILDQKGISFKCDKLWGSSVPITWDDIAYLSASETKTKAPVMEVYLQKNRYSPWRRTLLKAMYPSYFSGEEEFKLCLPLNHVSPGQSRQSLKIGLSRHVSQGHIDRKLLDILNPVNPASYTTLWFDSLSSAPRRASEELLCSGSLVANGRYEIVDQLAAGGQGTIYSAKRLPESPESNENRLVVLKEFVLPSHAGYEVSSKTLENIQREASLLEKLNDPKIVHLLEFFVEDHRAYLVLEYVDGPSLNKLIEQHGPLEWEAVAKIGIQICEILEYLHNHTPPIVHRDLTPDNIILKSDNSIKLIDFNVAQQLESTTTRTIVGKHCYIPPEQFRGKAGNQSDIYSAGATLYFLLTGADPEPITASHPKKRIEYLDSKIDEVIARATDLDMEKRFKNAAEFKQALRETMET